MDNEMLKIRKYPDPVLRMKAEPVDELTDDLLQLAEEMIDVMYQDDGVGLAAPQVGESVRLIVIDLGEGPLVLFNPEIVEKNDELEPLEEGCLSFPDIRVNISRPNQVIVHAVNKEGKKVEIKAEGMAAKVFQHEIDHLNGVLIIDHASSIQRSLLKPKLKKLEKEASLTP